MPLMSKLRSCGASASRNSTGPGARKREPGCRADAGRRIAEPCPALVGAGAASGRRVQLPSSALYVMWRISCGGLVGHVEW